MIKNRRTPKRDTTFRKNIADMLRNMLQWWLLQVWLTDSVAVLFLCW